VTGAKARETDGVTGLKAALWNKSEAGRTSDEGLTLLERMSIKTPMAPQSPKATYQNRTVVKKSGAANIGSFWQ
jgi:hypothetical protein